MGKMIGLNLDIQGKDGVSMIIRTTAKSVYYPMAGHRADVIRGSGRFRYVRRSLVVKQKV